MNKRSQRPVKPTATEPTGYGALLAELKSRVRTAQARAAVSVNAELVRLTGRWGITSRSNRPGKAGARA